MEIDATAVVHNPDSAKQFHAPELFGTCFALAKIVFRSCENTRQSLRIRIQLTERNAPIASRNRRGDRSCGRGRRDAPAAGERVAVVISGGNTTSVNFDTR